MRCAGKIRRATDDGTGVATVRLRDEPDVSHPVYAPVVAGARDRADPAGIVRLDADIRRIIRQPRRARSILSRRHTHAATELPRGVVRITPSDLSRDATDWLVGLAQQDGHSFDSDHRQVRDRCLAVRIHEHAADLRWRQMHRASKLRQCPAVLRFLTQQIGGESSLKSQGGKRAVARHRRTSRTPLCRGLPRHRHSDEWCNDIDDREQQGLHPKEPIRSGTIETKGRQLVEPRRDVAHAIVADFEDLRWFRICCVDCFMGLESMCHDRRVLPEDLIHKVVVIQVERCRDHCAVWHAAAQRVCRK